MLKNHFKKMATFIIAILLLIGYAGIHAPQVSAASTKTVGNGKYTIINSTTMSAQYNGPAKKSATSASIPDTIKISGKTYKITSIAANAFKNNKKIKKLTIGKNVTTIGKNAFYGCKNLKNVTIKTKKLTKNSVGTKAFKGLNTTAVIFVPSENVEPYKSILKSAGLTGNKIEIKSKDTVSDNENSSKGTDKTSWENYQQGQTLPDPKQSAFTIGDFSIQNPGYIDENKITNSTEYSIGDDISFTAGMRLDERLYGDWKKEYVTGENNYFQCGKCGKNFESDQLLGLHGHLMECVSANYLFYETKEPYYGWYFYPDNSPCSVVYKFTLSDGVSFKENGLEVKARGKFNIPDKNYTVTVADNCVTVTINDIKASPFYTQFNKSAYDKNPYGYELGEYEGDNLPINILFNVVINENAKPVNTVTADVTYSYKGTSKTINLGSRSIYTASMKINHTDTEKNPLTGGTFTLYKQEVVVPEGSSIGTFQWQKVKSGLKSGDVVNGIGQKCYKIVQDTFPDGYRKYTTPEFSVRINTNGSTPTITATDENSFEALKVNNGVVQVGIENMKISGGGASTSNSKNAENAKPPVSNKDTVESEPEKESEKSEQSLDVVVTYYKDSVKESSMLYKTNDSISSGMLNTKNISSRSYVFKGCTLQKITLNGEEIKAIPDYVKVGSNICFYYKTNNK